jgi:trk system potassium uptake protein TrkH
MKLNFNSMNFHTFYKLVFYLSLFGIGILIYDFGYSQQGETQTFVNLYYFIVLVLGMLATTIRYLKKEKGLEFKVIVFDILSSIVIMSVLFLHFSGFDQSTLHTYLYDDLWVKLAILLTLVREFASLDINYNRTFLNPAQLFILSFIIIILGGTFLLMLPNATTNGISFVDALFTSTSAVCVTGLAVVDTSSAFTHFGHYIILFLIQIGGLGILTFTSFFSHFFKGESSFENHLVLQDMTGAQKVGEVFRLLKNILVITFTIEFIGALIIYSSISTTPFETTYDRGFFAAFHSVSSFCNAGFSTLSNSLYETGFQYNYFLHLNIIFLLVLGGLGFPIVSNTLQYFKFRFEKFISRWTKKKIQNRPWVMNLNSRIIVITSLSLIVVGTILLYFSEYNNTLKDHNGFGKFVTALFAATTPRTAGFNTVNMAQLTDLTLMITILLMWIGASPASTGGGIKTSTFAIAILNFVSLAKGKSRIEIFRRQISENTVQRAFAVIFLSLFIIGIGISIILFFDADKGFMKVAFESFSAYSTVGLSIGITSSLSTVSKSVLIALMFIGRVSMLSILIALFRKEKYKNYRYPYEDVLIN